MSAEHLIQDFLKLQEALGRRPSISEYSFQFHTPKVLDRVFGKKGKSGWKRMISAVGAKALPKNVLSASHLVDDYIELSKRLGRKPSFTEFKRLQRHTIKVLDRVFGRPGWSNLTSTAQKKDPDAMILLGPIRSLLHSKGKPRGMVPRRTTPNAISEQREKP